MNINLGLNDVGHYLTDEHDAHCIGCSQHGGYCLVQLTCVEVEIIYDTMVRQEKIKYSNTLNDEGSMVIHIYRTLIGVTHYMLLGNIIILSTRVNMDQMR